MPKCKLENLLKCSSHLSKQNQKNTKMVGIGNTCTRWKSTKSKSLYFNNPKNVPQTSNEHNSTANSNYLEFECKYDFHAPSSTFVKISCCLFHFDLCIVETHGFKFQTLTIKIQKGWNNCFIYKSWKKFLVYVVTLYMKNIHPKSMPLKKEDEFTPNCKHATFPTPRM